MVAQGDMLQGAVQVQVEGRSLRAIRAGEHSLLQGITGDTALGPGATVAPEQNIDTTDGSNPCLRLNSGVPSLTAYFQS